MKKNNCGSRFANGEVKDLSRVHNAQGQTAFRNRRIANDGMLGVEQNNLKHFMAEIAQVRVIMVKKIGTGGDPSARRQGSGEAPPPEFQSRLELGRFRRPDSRDLT